MLAGLRRPVTRVRTAMKQAGPGGSPPFAPGVACGPIPLPIPLRARRSLIKRLGEIRKRGYDEGPSDTISSVADICFPVFDHYGVVAALNIVYTPHRDVRVTIPAARDKLRLTAQAISKSLGWLGPKHKDEIQEGKDLKREGFAPVRFLGGCFFPYLLTSSSIADGTALL